MLQPRDFSYDPQKRGKSEYKRLYHKKQGNENGEAFMLCLMSENVHSRKHSDASEHSGSTEKCFFGDPSHTVFCGKFIVHTDHKGKNVDKYNQKLYHKITSAVASFVFEILVVLKRCADNRTELSVFRKNEIYIEHLIQYVKSLCRERLLTRVGGVVGFHAIGKQTAPRGWVVGFFALHPHSREARVKSTVE